MMNSSEWLRAIKKPWVRRGGSIICFTWASPKTEIKDVYGRNCLESLLRSYLNPDPITTAS